MGAITRNGVEFLTYNGGEYEKKGYYNKVDLQSFLDQGYVGMEGKYGQDFNYIYNPTTKQALRVKPGSGTTAATRAGGTSTLVSPTGKTDQFTSGPTQGVGGAPTQMTPSQGDIPFVVDGTSYIAPGGDRTKAVLASEYSPQPVQTQTPGTTAGFYKVPTGGVGPGGEQIFDVFEGNRKVELPEFQQSGLNMNALSVGQAPGGFQSQFPEVKGSKFEQGFNAAQGAGAEVPGDATGEQSILDTYSPSGALSAGDVFAQNDPYLSGLIETFREYTDPENQRASLAETYQQMLKDSGVEDLDMEMVNIKNVIEGSEDDIRTEITKAGGFATESQVLALTNARNKSLIKNYNKLVDLRNAKASYLETAIGLEAQDREAADRRFESMFNMGMQIAEYGQKMQENAYNRLVNLQDTIGLDGIYASVQGDPNAVRLIERTMGMPSGSLAVGAQQAVAAKQAIESKEALDLELQQAKLTTERLQQEKIQRDFSGEPEQNVRRMAIQATKIDSVNNLLGDKYLTSAVGPNAAARFSFTSFLTGGKQNFVAGIEQLRSDLNLQALIDAKARGATFGALSDQELKILSNAATKLGSWAVQNDSGQVTGYNVNETEFRRELDKINNFAKLDFVLKGGEPTDVGVIRMADGSYWVTNSDGSMTQL